MTSLERAVLLLYDPARHTARAVGGHGLDPSLIAQVEATLDEAPMAERALADDRVIAVSEDLDRHLPRRFTRLAGITTVVCGPVAAGGQWFGVIFADRGGKATFELNDDEEQTMLTLGRLAALAVTVRRSTRRQERAKQLDERIALTREVHEQVIQRLFGLSMALGAEQLGPEERRRCSAELEGVLAQLRLTLGRPLAPQEPATDLTLSELVVQRTRKNGLKVEWESEVEVPEHLEPLAQSVALEALRNAERHADAKRTTLRVGRTSDAFELEVSNDGVRSGRKGAGVGLRLLTFEALQHNGLLEFGPVEPNGWRVRLLVPISDD